MSVNIKRVEILEVNLPLRKVFKHALHTRRVSGSVFARLSLESGIVGYGEALPREYVTGETTGSVFSKLRKVLPNRVMKSEFSGLEGVSRLFTNMKELDGSAKCVIELALLDAVGRHFNESISTITGGPAQKNLFATGIIGADSMFKALKSAVAAKLFGFKAVKVKVGLGDDLKRLGIVRKILGDKVDIKVDANCAWNAYEAVRNINRMRKFGIKAVEQPVAADDFESLKAVTDSVPEQIIADESIRTVHDAERLARTKACNMFNIRISKCGGILNALKIRDIARRNNINYEIGCQVGESGVLTAAGRHLACASEDAKYYEGSYGKFLLKEDITRENMTIGYRGKAGFITGPGLGINVIDKVLDKYTVDRFTIE